MANDDDEELLHALLDALFEFRKNRTECEAITTMLLRAGADVRRGTADGLSPLHIWLQCGDSRSLFPHYLLPVRRSVPFGVNPKLTTGITDDWELQTPLDSAIRLSLVVSRTARRKSAREFAMLLRAGAKIPTLRSGLLRPTRSPKRAATNATSAPTARASPLAGLPASCSSWADCGGH